MSQHNTVQLVETSYRLTIVLRKAHAKNMQLLNKLWISTKITWETNWKNFLMKSTFLLITKGRQKTEGPLQVRKNSRHGKYQRYFHGEFGQMSGSHCI